MKKLGILCLNIFCAISVFGQGATYGPTSQNQFQPIGTTSGGQTIVAGSNITTTTNGNSVTINGQSGGATNGIAQSSGNGTNTTITNLTINGTIAGTAIVPVAQGGTSTNSARAAGANIGIYELSASGGNNQYGWLFATPSFEGQIGNWYQSTKEANLVMAGSTSAGDWKHAFSFTGGIIVNGDEDLSDPNDNFSVWHFNGNPALWGHSGDSGLSIYNWSTNSGSSGAFISFTPMTIGLAITNVTIVSGGGGYAVNDFVGLNGGTKGVLNINAKVVISGVSGGVVTSCVLFADGEYTVLPSGTVSTTAISGGGSGLTFTIAGAGKAMPSASGVNAALDVAGDFALEGINPGDLQMIQNYHALSDSASSSSMTSGGPTGVASGVLDSGNYSGWFIDWTHGVSGFPKWTIGRHQYANTNFTTNDWGFYVTNVTGLAYAPYGITALTFTGSGAGLTSLGGANFASTFQAFSVFGNQTSTAGSQPNSIQSPVVISLATTNSSGGGLGTSDVNGNITSYGGVFTGNGSNLTSLNANNVSSGLLSGTFVNIDGTTIKNVGGQLQATGTSDASTNGTTVVYTNLAINTLYTNNYGGPITVQGVSVVYNEAAVTGVSAISLSLTNGALSTNINTSQTTALGIATGSMTNAFSSFIVTNGGTWQFRDTSTGAGNSANVSGMQITYVQQLCVATSFVGNGIGLTNIPPYGVNGGMAGHYLTNLLLFSDNFANLNNWQKQGPATWTASGNTVTTSGGGNAFGNYLVQTNVIINPTRFSTKFRFFFTSTNANTIFGWGLRDNDFYHKANANDQNLLFLMTCDRSNPGNFGTMFCYMGTSNAPLLSASNTVIESMSTLNSNQWIDVVFQNQDNVYSSYASNEITHAVEFLSMSLKNFNVAFAITNYEPHCPSFTFVSFGGSAIIDGSVTNVCPNVNWPVDTLVVGDSISLGYGSSNAFNTLPYQLRQANPTKSIEFCATEGNSVTNCFLMTNSYKLFSPIQTILQVGVNDQNEGVTAATTFQNYTNLMNGCPGKVVVTMVTPWGTDMSAYNNSILTNSIGRNTIMNWWNPLRAFGATTPTPGVMATDNIHPQALGYTIIFPSINAIISGQTNSPIY